jgi:uncharacterized protein (DUF1697 family)
VERYVALLRGINIGSRKRVAMADLRALLGDLGHTDVATYVQSGNAVFTGKQGDPAKLARQIERRIVRDLGVEAPVVVRTRDELAAVVDANPFPERTAEPKKLNVSFLSGEPDLKRLDEVGPEEYEPDEFALGDRVIYLWLPNGFQGAKLHDAFWQRAKLGVHATARNWNTVTKLLDLADASPP